jgi:hypothetical protein
MTGKPKGSVSASRSQVNGKGALQQFAGAPSFLFFRIYPSKARINPGDRIQWKEKPKSRE